MERLSDERLREIATIRGIDYDAIGDSDPLVVRTRMARPFHLPQETVFDSFADPMSHVPLFAIIKSSTPAIRKGLEQIIPQNQFFAFEHVEEGALPPRLMLVRYTLDRPSRITKEALTDPFLSSDVEIFDKKKGLVIMGFDRLGEHETRVTTESVFHSTTGAVFARGFIDHVWLNFFERMMVVNGMITEDEMLTKA